MIRIFGSTDIGGIPDPEDTTWWFLVNVVGLPIAVVMVLASLGYHCVDQGSARRGARAWIMTGAAIRSGRWSALAGAVLAQTGFVIMSYVLGQMFQIMFEKGSTGISLADGKPYDTTDVIAAAFDYNHWTPISLRVVQGALLFVLVSTSPGSSAPPWI